MPKVDVNGVKIYYEISGEDDAFPMVWHGHHHLDWIWQKAYFNYSAPTLRLRFEVSKRLHMMNLRPV